MKVDQYGTENEQKRFYADWSSKSLDRNKRCELCHHFELNFDRSAKGSPWCDKYEMRTLVRASCRDWTPERPR